MYKYPQKFDVGYHRFAGTWAWIFHRLSGLALVFYISLHIWVINTLTKGPEAYNELMDFLGSPLFKFLEVGLWGVILFHAFNGIRIVIIDFGRGGSERHKRLLTILSAMALALWAWGSWTLIAYVIG